METKYNKLVQTTRWGFYMLFVTVAVLAFIGFTIGYYKQILIALGCFAIARVVKKYW